MEQSFRILLVDDENDILEFVTYNLQKEGFQVYTASNGAAAVKLAEEVMPHLILLDVMMPEMDGIETCQVIRSNPKLKNILVAFLTARGEDYSQIAGFDAGGDDYISKPIKPKVLVSRIKALLKRHDFLRNEESATNSNENVAGIVMDRERFLVVKNGEDLVLPKKEFELLALLHSKPNKVFTRDEIFSSIWGDNIIVGDRTIDVHIRKLREKIGDDFIKTIKGVGYKFVD
ncbi:response regulator transcription factor [Williamwhitmania taraxaci]|uniref:Two-component system, OmpR family, alkaline phosphatase synthesis response regulator PhoP n=1 Tax=Williamwhitmania taraxaci TaxID=1640674 RepID=A0A1G6NEB7_9BACT|nr:response regulator transcription factor [Williamwhitmania taraxaci]SDC66051.1 two-component system, OmpR family, alkaline phosphatase synthesis response regulator PhoP [Williamwhitmania taraxaci]